MVISHLKQEAVLEVTSRNVLELEKNEKVKLLWIDSETFVYCSHGKVIKMRKEMDEWKEVASFLLDGITDVCKVEELVVSAGNELVFIGDDMMESSRISVTKGLVKLCSSHACGSLLSLHIASPFLGSVVVTPAPLNSPEGICRTFLGGGDMEDLKISQELGEKVMRIVYKRMGRLEFESLGILLKCTGKGYMVLQTLFVRDLFLRSCSNVHEALEALSMANGMQVRFEFRKGTFIIFLLVGSLHHLAALALWVQDFCNGVTRFLVSYFQVGVTDSGMWIFLLDRGCRRILIELLVFLKSYHTLILGYEVSGHEKYYLSELAKEITNSHIQFDVFLSFLLGIGDTSSLPEVDELEFQLLVNGILDLGYLPFIAGIQPNFETVSKKLYYGDKPIDPNLLLKPSRSHEGFSKIDAILKTNIRTGAGTQKCSRCKAFTQLTYSVDNICSAFQISPAWKNAYQDTCFCGGYWT